MVIVIPCYEPDEKLLNLIEDLNKKINCKILIIDDGSGKKYNKIFNFAADLGAKVIRYSENKGKGFALKTAFKELKRMDNVEGIITADCDGQHTAEDILNVMNSIKNSKNTIALGTRHFNGNVPFRSLFGNKVTSFVLMLFNGNKFSDTQTGLRGFTPDTLDWLSSLDGDRYEYEMNMLLEADINNYVIKEIPIETIYIEDNKSSHFRPLIDSIKIYFPILKFSMSSILSGILDFILLLLFKMATSNLLISVLLARLCSLSFNYALNRTYVFANKTANKISLPKYLLLALMLLIFNYIILNYLCTIGLNLIIAKLLTEALLFVFSFAAQKKFVFK